LIIKFKFNTQFIFLWICYFTVLF